MVMSREVQRRFKAALQAKDLAGLRVLAKEFDVDELTAEKADRENLLGGTQSLLTEAIDDRNADDLRMLLDAGADPNRNKAIVNAAHYGDAQAVRMLLEAGADQNLEDALERAAQSGDVSIVDDLLAHGALASKRPGALRMAAEFGQPIIVKRLLDAGAKPDEQGSRRNATPLACACFGKSDKHLECVRVFLALGADPNSLNINESTTPLILAAGYGSPQMIRELVQAGADPNMSVDSVERAPIFAAVLAGRLENVKTLLELGADPALHVTITLDRRGKTRTPSGLTPLEVAKAPGRKRVVKSIVDLLQNAIVKATAPYSTPSVRKSWEVIPTALGENRCFGSSSPSRLLKGASLEEIERLQERCGSQLPEDFRASYSICGGQLAGSWPFVTNVYDSRDGEKYRLLSLDEIEAEWRKQMESSPRDRSHDLCERHFSRETGVSDCWWHRGWIPFAVNEHLDYLFVDLSPMPSRQSGQVVAWRDGDTRILSPSFAEWLADLSATLVA